MARTVSRVPASKLAGFARKAANRAFAPARTAGSPNPPKTAMIRDRRRAVLSLSAAVLSQPVEGWAKDAYGPLAIRRLGWQAAIDLVKPFQPTGDGGHHDGVGLIGLELRGDLQDGAHRLVARVGLRRHIVVDAELVFGRKAGVGGGERLQRRSGV